LRYLNVTQELFIEEHAIRMAFCGQCGLLLPSNVINCPRCNTEVPASWEAADQNANAPTIISTPNDTQKSKRAYSPELDLVQEPNQITGYNTKMQRTGQGKHTPIPPTIDNPPFAGYHTQPPIAPSSPDYMSQNSRDFSSTQGAPYPDAALTTQGVPYPSYAPPMPPAYPPPVPPRKTNKWAMLLGILLILILAGGAVAMLVVGPGWILQIVRGGTIVPQMTPVPTTSQVATPVPPTSTAQSSPTPEQQARSIIDSYYTAINSKDYQTAYNLWLNYPDSYQKFANGFADTSHDDYTFGNVLPQSDGPVQVNLTIIATSTSYQQTTYQGYYIVQQQTDGSWKICSAKIHKG
jgi:hypothetical protein